METKCYAHTNRKLCLNQFKYYLPNTAFSKLEIRFKISTLFDDALLLEPFEEKFLFSCGLVVATRNLNSSSSFLICGFLLKVLQLHYSCLPFFDNL